MAAKRQSFLAKLESEIPEKPATVTAPEPRAAAAPAKNGITKTTVYIPDAVHERLREIAYIERVKMHDLIMEGLDRVMEHRGHPERAGNRKVV